MPLAPAIRLGSYEIVAPLGAGGMGEVYQARDLRLGREAAIKLIPESPASSADRLARFEREARTVASLNHPNITDDTRFLALAGSCHLRSLHGDPKWHPFLKKMGFES
jgi:serine/threonine protein kinase